MVIRRRAYALTFVALLLTASSLLAQPKEQTQTRKLSNDEKKELQAISTMLSAGQAPANDLSLAWAGNDLLKAQGNKEYVPFTITLDPSKLTGKRVSLYWRVVSKDAPAPDPKAKKDDKAAAQYAFENLHTVDLPSTPGPVRLSRSFVVGPGSYDVYVMAKEPDPKKKGDPPAKTGMLKQGADRSRSLERRTDHQLGHSCRADRPACGSAHSRAAGRASAYALGNMEIVPAPGAKLSKKGELSVSFS